MLTTWSPFESSGVEDGPQGPRSRANMAMRLRHLSTVLPLPPRCRARAVATQRQWIGRHIRPALSYFCSLAPLNDFGVGNFRSARHMNGSTRRRSNGSSPLRWTHALSYRSTTPRGARGPNVRDADLGQTLWRGRPTICRPSPPLKSLRSDRGVATAAGSDARTCGPASSSSTSAAVRARLRKLEATMQAEVQSWRQRRGKLGDLIRSH